jgi:hypothetical protein
LEVELVALKRGKEADLATFEEKGRGRACDFEEKGRGGAGDFEEKRRGGAGDFEEKGKCICCLLRAVPL